MNKFKLLVMLAVLSLSQASFGAICEIVKTRDGNFMLLKDGESIAKSKPTAINSLRVYLYTLKIRGICEDSNPPPDIGTPPRPPEPEKPSYDIRKQLPTTSVQ